MFTLTKHPLCNLGQCCHYIETSPLIYGANWWDGFYIMATLDWNKLILTTTFPIYYFFLSWRNPLSPSVQPNQTYFSQKHKTQNSNWQFSHHRHKQFYVLLNTNQIKLYTYPDFLKQNPLPRKFLNSESTAYFLNETFYHTHIRLFSMTTSATIVIKATEYSTFYIIHNLYDVETKYSIISTQKCKVILPGW